MSDPTPRAPADHDRLAPALPGGGPVNLSGVPESDRPGVLAAAQELVDRYRTDGTRTPGGRAAVPAADRVGHPAAPAGAAGPGGRAGAMNEHGRREFRDGVAALVGTRFGGSYRAAFEHYDRNGAGRIDWEGLITLLADAAVGTRGPRPRWWTAAVMVELDGDGDGCLSWAEFAAVFSKSPEPDRPEAATRVDGPRGAGR